MEEAPEVTTAADALRLSRIMAHNAHVYRSEEKEARETAERFEEQAHAYRALYRKLSQDEEEKRASKADASGSGE